MRNTGAQRLACLLLAVAAAAFTPAMAEPPRHLFIEDLTWTELRREVEAGVATVIIPIGGVEQSGPHMALGKHGSRVRQLSGRIAEAVGGTLVAPVISYVPEGNITPPTEHMRFPGTLTIPGDAFERTLESAARSLRAHGFRDIVFLGDHGGYRTHLARVAQKLNREWARSPARVHPLPEYYEAVARDYPAALRARGIPEAAIGTHAGLADTSLTLALDPSLVRRDVLQHEEARLPRFGVTGDPRQASAELGRIGVDLIVARSVEAIRKATRRPPQ